MINLSRLMMLTASVAVMGCGATLSQLRTRASVDLSCAEQSLQLQPLDGATQVVTGCGKRAVYVEQFNNARNPTWLLNSSVEAISVPPGAQSSR